MTRTYIWNAGPNDFNVAATCAPGGTNSLQSSSNLVDWVTTQTTTSPYIYAGPYQFSDELQMFYRVKKEY